MTGEMMIMPTEIIIAALALVGTLAGSYFSNRKNNALIEYRLQQVERKVEKLDVTAELQKLRERVARLEERVGGGE